jgi:hypothetical protein
MRKNARKQAAGTKIEKWKRRRWDKGSANFFFLPHQQRIEYCGFQPNDPVKPRRFAGEAYLPLLELSTVGNVTKRNTAIGERIIS